MRKDEIKDMSNMVIPTLASALCGNIDNIKKASEENDVNTLRTMFSFLSKKNIIILQDKQYGVSNSVDNISVYDSLELYDYIRTYQHINGLDSINTLIEDIKTDIFPYQKQYIAGIGSRETPPDTLRLMNKVMGILTQDGWTLRSGGAKGADEAFERAIPRIGNKIDKRMAEIFIPWNGFTGQDISYKKTEKDGYMVNIIPKDIIYALSVALKTGYYGDNVFSQQAMIGFMKSLTNFHEIDMIKDIIHADEMKLQTYAPKTLEELSGIITNQALSKKVLQLSYVVKYHPKPNFLSPGGIQLMARNSEQILGRTLDNPSHLVLCYTKGGKSSGGTGQAIRMAQDYNIPIIDLGHPSYANLDKMGVIQEIYSKTTNEPAPAFSL